jgi:phosphoserine phosphatase
MVNERSLPLAIDLDGTLAKGDVFEKTLWNFIIYHPFKSPIIFYWWWKGVPYLKYMLEVYANFDVSQLEYNLKLIDYIKEERLKGCKTLLITGSTDVVAKKVQDHLKIFDEAYGSTSRYNMVGQNKAAVLVDMYGEKGFTYAGDSPKDIYVWAHAGEAIVFSDHPDIFKKAQKVCKNVWKFNNN